jgi:hypothetical protein
MTMPIPSRPAPAEVPKPRSDSTSDAAPRGPSPFRGKLRKVMPARGKWELPERSDWEAHARPRSVDWQKLREGPEPTKAIEPEPTDALATLHERIEKRFQAWLDGPQHQPDPEIALLDSQAAALIRARTDATLRPIEAAIEAARRRAEELLGK